MADDGVVRLVTSAEREVAEEEAYAVAANAEAVSMLERALAMAKERRVSSVAIAIAFDDGGYGHLTPLAGNSIGHLKGAVADMQWALCRRSDEG